MTVARAELEAVFQDTASGVHFSIIVLPRSSKCELTGLHDGALKVKLTKPPVDGAANVECCRFFARLLGIAKSRVSIVRGLTSRHKLMQAQDITAAQCITLMQGAMKC